jgi:DNA-binding CsgD family transcriptional regulator
MFSAREFDIARLIVEKDEKESTIARRLGISVHTVHIHLNRLFVKVGVHSRAQLIVMVFREFEAHIRQP